MSRALSTFVCCLVALLFSSLASAQTMFGHGNSQCLTFNQAQNNAPQVEQAFDIWVVGYLSGVNFFAYAVQRNDRLADRDFSEMVSFVRGYCRANPTRTIANAANAYWFSLGERDRQTR